MRKFLMIAAVAMIASPSLVAPALAADVTMETQLGTSMDEVKASLVDMGYEVRKLEIEDGNIEAYVVKDNAMGQIFVSPETGKPVKVVMR